MASHERSPQMVHSLLLKRPGVIALAIGLCLGVSPRLLSSELRWQEAGAFRFAQLSVSANNFQALTLLPPAATGITFSNVLSDAAVSTNRLLEVGSGAALGDVDGDGWVDVYFCRLEGGNVLYRNRGNWTFEDITQVSGVSCPGQFSTGCVFADFDGDHDLDLLVNSLGGGTRAFANDGDGRFSEMTDTRLVRRSGATSLALADVDGDTDLDLYVTNYRTDTFHDHPPGLKITTRRAPDGALIFEPADRFIPLPIPNGGYELIERGESDFLYINRGEGRFSPARWDVGVFLDETGKPVPEGPPDWGLAVLFRDLNGDRLPDLYVCNDFVFWPDRIWLNQQGKRFQAAPVYAFRNVSLSSMSADVADVNRDGFDDIFVGEMLSARRESRAWQRPDTLRGVVDWPIENPEFRQEVTRNTLQLARGDGTFAEIAQLAGVAATDWTWGVAFVDVDLDGWEDLLVATGNNHDVQDADVLASLVRAADMKTPAQRLQHLKKTHRRETMSLALRNRRDLTFENMSAAWGFDAVGIAHGLALGDLDNDGDLDVVLNCLNAPARVYRNNSTAARLAVRLNGAGHNSRGVGAKIRVTGGPVAQSQEMICGGRYCSGDDAMRTFATGDAAHLQIEVMWRSGRRSIVEGAKPNHVYEINEAGATVTQDDTAEAARPLFEDVSTQLNHMHVDESFDDFKRQPLLPRKLSSLGPGVAWADVDADGDDDLVLGGGKGGRLAVFKNDSGSGFQEWANAVGVKTNDRDQTGLVVWRGDGSTRIVMGESNWEDASPSPSSMRVYTVGSGSLDDALELPLNGGASVGPIAMADVDGDGDLDLFVGGRAIAGRYPEAASSHIFTNANGRFTVAQSFTNFAMVSGSVFGDFDSDGDPDLALACEWDSIRLFRNERGRFQEITAAAGFSELKGWWNGIATGDFNADGRLDLVASNWGRNWRTDEPAGRDLPVDMFYGEFAGNGVVQTLLASLDVERSIVAPWRDRKSVAAAIPSLVERIPSFHAYGRASVTEVLGPSGAQIARRLVATTGDSMIFLNRGGRFEARPLPIEAQFAPAFGVSVADFDGDGHEDLFLAQNFFGVDGETSRHDAGVGLVLLGNGRGDFRALGPRETGFALYGEQRGSAVSDFDADGRVDLVVAQNNGPTKLLRNVRATPGVRVTVAGRESNAHAVGAAVRIKMKSGFGPIKEIHAGNGYWSQDSATLVFAAPTQPVAVWIRWPGGKEQEWPWPQESRSIQLRSDGVVRIDPRKGRSNHE